MQINTDKISTVAFRNQTLMNLFFWSYSIYFSMLTSALVHTSGLKHFFSAGFQALKKGYLLFDPNTGSLFNSHSQLFLHNYIVQPRVDIKSNNIIKSN